MRVAFFPPSRCASASEVRGPEAMTTSPWGISVTSPSFTVILGWERTRSVTSRAKPWRSTARAPPASTRVASAQERIRLPRRRISSFKSPTAFSSWSLRSELEQHSSAKYSVSWAGVFFSGFISQSVTWTPRWASCQAHSLPARPAPITVTCMVNPSLLDGPPAGARRKAALSADRCGPAGSRWTRQNSPPF